MEKNGRHVGAEALIVHAIIAPDGDYLSHAWIEWKDFVYFSGFINGKKVLVEADRIEYLSNCKWRRIVKYTLLEAYLEEKKAGHFGPWDPKIRILCKDLAAHANVSEVSNREEKSENP